MTAMPGVGDGFDRIPDHLAESYRAAGYWTRTSLGGLLRGAASRWPGRPVLHTGDGVRTYRELDTDADRMAHGLLASGVAPGDRVVVQLPNVAEFVVVLFGLLRAGAIPVLTLPAHRRTEIMHFAELSGATAYITADRIRDFDYRELATEVVDAVPSVRQVLVLGDPGPFRALSSVPCEGNSLPEPNPGELALLLVSGGTTGLPKLIPRTHEDYSYNARASAEVCGCGPDDVYLATLPVAHNFPLACPGILGTIATGGSIAFTAAASPDAAFSAIERHRVTLTAVVPQLAQLWCAATEWENADLSSLRLLQVGGAKLAETNARAIRPALGAQLQQVFGMAEGLLNFTRLDDDDEIVSTTQGRPLSPADEIRVVDADGNDVAPGEQGELLTRGPYTIRGYYRAPQHNSNAFTPDGYYRSGDLVRRLPSGHLVVCGRIKDVISRGGENISCAELEEHLLAYPGIRHAAAVGVPHGQGEKVCAVVVVDGETPTLADLRGFLIDRGLASFKLPDMIRKVTSLPVTAVGKIDRKALRIQH
ncbi:AMP-binding protein [Nocardia amamiensis]|uniref:AMP-binding protein n=1 Tax=Nocardia amamiensis TaxID=404578 RepID=A0ABS0D2J3_9NOCA|nr:AMP-binding protein [Nocardia amamiensis]